MESNSRLLVLIQSFLVYLVGRNHLNRTHFSRSYEVWLNFFFSFLNLIQCKYLTWTYRPVSESNCKATNPNIFGTNTPIALDLLCDELCVGTAILPKVSCSIHRFEISWLILNEKPAFICVSSLYYSGSQSRFLDGLVPSIILIRHISILRFTTSAVLR